MAIAGAVQAKSFDLTQYRQRSLAERRVKVRAEDAAGALAFASMDQYKGLDGKPTGVGAAGAERLQGDRLAPLLLRLKYAAQPSKEAFQRAHLILLRRHGWLARRPSETMFAVAYAAILEWVHDACPECRVRSAGAQEPQPCEACQPREVGRGPVRMWGRHAEVDTAKGPRLAVTSSPKPGCPKCWGFGSIPAKEKKSRGMACTKCGNSGRVKFEAKDRWRLVTDYLATAHAARGEPFKGLDYETFIHHWQRRYYRFMDALQAADRQIVANIDLAFRRGYSRGTEETPIEIEDVPIDPSPRTEAPSNNKIAEGVAVLHDGGAHPEGVGYPLKNRNR